MDDIDGFVVIQSRKKKRQIKEECKKKDVVLCKKEMKENKVNKEVNKEVHKDIQDVNKVKWKTMLCENMVFSGSCSFGNHCHYAHSKKEQIMDPMRKKVFDIINSHTNIAKLDLIHNEDLYKTLLIFTRLCYKCMNNECVGGINCKCGISDEKYLICKDDLYSGQCFRNCNSTHLTEFGLIPYKVQFMLNSENKNEIKPPNSLKEQLQVIMNNQSEPDEPEETLDDVIFNDDDADNIVFTIV